MNISIFNVIPHKDADNVKLIERLNYIRNPMATNENLTYGSFVSCRYPFDEMMVVKYCYATPKNNTLNGKQFIEYIVSLPAEESNNLQNFACAVRDITNFLAKTYGQYQTISCIHLNTDNLHAHIIANNIDFMNGTRFTLDINHFYAIREGISNILSSHGFSAIK